jgi:hypothetical protein
VKIAAGEVAKFRARYGIRSLSVAVATKKTARTAKQRAHFGKLAKALEKKRGHKGATPNPRLMGSTARLRAQAGKAASLYQRFTKQKAEPFGYAELPDPPKAGAIMGYCDAIEYTTQRKGQVQLFRHKFHQADAPLLVVGPTGTPIIMLGGRYRWTDRGITDRSDPK